MHDNKIIYVLFYCQRMVFPMAFTYPKHLHEKKANAKLQAMIFAEWPEWDTLIIEGKKHTIAPNLAGNEYLRKRQLVRCHKEGMHVVLIGEVTTRGGYDALFYGEYEGWDKKSRERRAKYGYRLQPVRVQIPDETSVYLVQIQKKGLPPMQVTCICAEAYQTILYTDFLGIV